MCASELRKAIELYLAKGGQIQPVRGFSAPSPHPARRAWIDPETKFQRNDRYIRPLHAQMLSTAERKQLRAMAEHL